MATINRHHEKRVFSKIAHFACFDKNFNIEWCDDNELFRRITSANKRIKQKFEAIKKGETVVHYFLYKGVYHRALINETSSGGFACRISKEITEEELAIDDLFEYVDEMSNNCLNILTIANVIEEYAENTSYNNDFFHENFAIQRKETLGIYSHCQNIIGIFNNVLNEEFIPLQKYLFRTLDIIQHVTRRLPRTISMCSDIVFPATKLDYSKLELALYNLIKFALIHSKGQNNLILSVKRESLNEISVELNFKLNPDFKFSESKLEMHTIKFLFRKLKGHFEFFEEGDMMYAKGSFNAEFSLNESDIAEGRDIEFIDNPELLEKKSASDKYIGIYRNVTDKNKMFASNLTTFSDVEDDCVRFAEMFFGDVIIKD